MKCMLSSGYKQSTTPKPSQQLGKTNSPSRYPFHWVPAGSSSGARLVRDVGGLTPTNAVTATELTQAPNVTENSGALLATPVRTQNRRLTIKNWAPPRVKSPVKAPPVNIHKAFLWIGENAHLYSTDNFRVGRCTDLAKNGRPTPNSELQVVGRVYLSSRIQCPAVHRFLGASFLLDAASSFVRAAGPYCPITRPSLQLILGYYHLHV